MRHTNLIGVLLWCVFYLGTLVPIHAEGTEEAGRPPGQLSAIAHRATAIRATRKSIQDTVLKSGGWRGWNEKLTLFNTDIQRRGKRAEAAKQAYLTGPTESLFTLALTRFAMDHALPAGDDGGQDIHHTSAFKTIVGLHNDLAARNIDLIFVPIPQKEEIYPKDLSLAAPTDVPLYPQRYRYMDALLEADVEVVDLLPALNAGKAVATSPLYPKSDLHWGNAAMGIATQLLAERLARYDFTHPSGPNPYTTKPFRVETQGPLVKYFVPPERQKGYEPLVDSGLQVLLPNGAPYEYNSIQDAPILMIGDSFMMRSRSGCSWAAQLACELGVPVTGFMQKKKGAQSVARILARKGPAFYKNRRVVILYGVGGMLSRLWYVQALAAQPE